MYRSIFSFRRPARIFLAAIAGTILITCLGYADPLRVYADRQVVSSAGETSELSGESGSDRTPTLTSMRSGDPDDDGVSFGYRQNSIDTCDCAPGDPNDDRTLNVGDAVYIITYIFRDGPAPTPYPTCSGDANCDCKINVSDAIRILYYVFGWGIQPCSCEEWLTACGPPLR